MEYNQEKGFPARETDWDRIRQQQSDSPINVFQSIQVLIAVRISSVIRICSITLLLAGLSIQVSWAANLVHQQHCDTDLIAAIHKNDTKLAEQILKTSKNLDSRSCPEGYTALIEAIATGHPELAIELINAGANPNLADNKAVTPLMMASWYCQSEVVALLLEKGALVNVRDSDGMTPLMHASTNCSDPSIVSFLLRSKAIVNASDNLGQTPLTLAVFYGNEYVVKLLVAHDADLDARTKDGQTVFSISKEIEVAHKPTNERISTFLSLVRGLKH